MQHRALALLGLIAALLIGGFLLFEREQDQAAPTETFSSSSPAEAAPVIELALDGGRAEALPLASAPATPREQGQAANEVPESKRASARSLESALTSTILVFRALDEGGYPVLGRISTSVKNRSHDHYGSSGAQPTTSGDGRFEVRIEPTLLEGDRRELHVGGRGGSLTARVDLSRLFAPGRIDMGDLVLRPAPCIAKGRVIDAAGRPVPGATILANGLPHPADEFGPYFGEAESSEDGAFALHGSTNASHATLTFVHRRLRAARLAVPVGSRGLEIVLRESGRVAGRVLVDPGVPARALRITLRPEDASAGAEAFDSSRSSGREEIDRDGLFEIEGLLPGRFVFSLGVERDVLAEVPGIEVTPGETTRDPRLQELDLRGRLQVFTLTLMPPPAKSGLQGRVCYCASGTAAPLRSQSFRGKTVELVTPLDAIDAIVRAQGCRTERLFALGTRTEVRLRSAIPVRLALPRDLAPPAPPLYLRVELEPADGPRPEDLARSYQDSPPTPPLDASGETVFLAREPGSMRVRWSVERRWGGGANVCPLELPFEQLVVVEDREDEQRIELRMTSQALAAALAAH